jgi:hypothetical protein
MRRRPLVWIVALLLVACSSDHDVNLALPPTSTNVTGTFVLTDANGIAPPFSAFLTSTEQWRLQSDVIVVAANGTWTEKTDYLVVTLADGTSQPRQIIVAGTYRLVNGQISFTMVEGGSSGFFGSVTGNALIILFNGKRFTYTSS